MPTDGDRSRSDPSENFGENPFSSPTDRRMPGTFDGSTDAGHDQPHATRRLNIRADTLANFLPLPLYFLSSILGLMILWGLWNLFLPDLSLKLFVALYFASSLLMLLKPVERAVAARFFGVRTPLPKEAAVLHGAWNEVAANAQVSPHRLIVGVENSDAPNAFAVGGHIVAVTKGAVDVFGTDPDALAGVIAHELGHHHGAHTWLGPVTIWLGLPTRLLLWLCDSLINVANWCTRVLAALGSLGAFASLFIALCIKAVAYSVLAVVSIANLASAFVSRRNEYAADAYAASIGYGPHLADGLEAFALLAPDDLSFRAQLASTHPPLHKRVERLVRFQDDPHALLKATQSSPQMLVLSGAAALISILLCVSIWTQLDNPQLPQSSIPSSDSEAVADGGPLDRDEERPRNLDPAAPASTSTVRINASEFGGFSEMSTPDDCNLRTVTFLADRAFQVCDDQIHVVDTATGTFESLDLPPEVPAADRESTVSSHPLGTSILFDLVTTIPADGLQAERSLRRRIVFDTVALTFVTTELAEDDGLVQSLAQSDDPAVLLALTRQRFDPSIALLTIDGSIVWQAESTTFCRIGEASDYAYRSGRLWDETCDAIRDIVTGAPTTFDPTCDVIAVFELGVLCRTEEGILLDRDGVRSDPIDGRFAGVVENVLLFEIDGGITGVDWNAEALWTIPEAVIAGRDMSGGRLVITNTSFEYVTVNSTTGTEATRASVRPPRTRRSGDYHWATCGFPEAVCFVKRAALPAAEAPDSSTTSAEPSVTTESVETLPTSTDS